MSNKRLAQVITVNELAAAFCRGLRRELNPADISDINRLNEEETLHYVCHSHDYCDANMIMYAALESFGMPFNMDFDDEIDRLWTAAWALAQRRKFDPLNIN